MPPMPRFEAPTPLAYFAALVADDASLPLLEAAVSLAQDDDPQLDVQAVLAEVDALGARLARRLPADAAGLQRLRLLNHYFFDELGFGGSVPRGGEPAALSYLPQVLRSRRGLPIALAVLYVELATAHARLPAHGVSFPGHFLLRVRLPAGEVVLDPLDGRSLSREALQARLAPYRRLQGGPLADEALVPLAVFLQPAGARETLARMLRNLQQVHRAALDWARLAAVQARLCVLLPQAWDEHREHALALAEIGRHREAAAALGRYLEHRPDSDDAPALRRRLTAWRGRG